MLRKAYILIAIVAGLAVSLFAHSYVIEENRFDELIQKAKAFVQLMGTEKYGAGVADFDATMSKVMPEPKLKQTWEALIKQVGPFQAQIGTRTEQIGKYDAVYVVCEFEKTKMDVKVVFDKDKNVERWDGTCRSRYF